MFPLPQQEIRSLVRQIKEKSLKENRLQACHELRNVICAVNHVQELNNNWREILEDMGSLISPKGGSLDVKKACGSVIGAIGSLLIREDFEEFLLWIKNEVNSCHERAEEERAIYIVSLCDSIRGISQRGALLSNGHIESVMTLISDLLDANNSHVVLVPLLDTCLTVSELYSHVFMAHFEEIVDFTIGWFVEDSLPSSVSDKCYEVISGLNKFWRQEPEFGKQLMLHFLEDITGFVEDSEKQGTLCESLSKARSILKVLSSILEIFVEFSNLDKAYDYVNIITEKALISCKDNIIRLGSIRSYAVADFFSGYCKILLIPALVYDGKNPDLISQCNSTIICLMCKFKSTQSALTVFIDYFVKLHSQTNLPLYLIAPLVDDLLVALDGIRLLGRSRLAMTIKSLLSSMMSPLSLPRLQATYAGVRQTLEADVKILRDKATGAKNSSVCIIREIEARLMVYIASLEQLAAMKNSFIIVMGLRPSLFVLLVEDLPLTEQWFIENHPGVHFSLLRIGHLHMQAHDYFLPNSEWLLDGSRNSVIKESLSSRFAQIQLLTLIKLLSCHLVWPSSRSLVAEWLHGLISGLSDSVLNTLSNRSEWQQLKSVLRKNILVEDCHDRVRSIAARLRALDARSVQEVSDLTKTAISKIRNCDEVGGMNIWASLDMRIYLRYSLSSAGWDHLEMGQSRVTASTFGSEDFVILTDFLLRKVVPSYHRDQNNEANWLVDTIEILYANCQLEGCVPKPESDKKINIAQQWRWVLAQVANYCVENRMKTSLGKPMETFNHFGAEIHRLAKEALTGTQPTVVKDNKKPTLHRRSKEDEENGESSAEPRELTQMEEWWRVRCLLEYLEILEKLIYNAHNGTMFPVCAVSLPARQFFITNLASCQEWLCRTYISAMVVAYNNGYYAQVIRFGSSALLDLEKKQQRVEASLKEGEIAPAPSGITYAVLCWLARSMAELGAEQAARGLSAWVKRVYHVEMRWIDASVEIAAARYESSLVLLRGCLEDPEVPESVKTILRDMKLNVLSRLRLPLLLDPLKCPPDLSIWNEADRLNGQNPAGFDAEALLRVKQLSFFGKIERIENSPSVKWNLEEAMMRCELHLMQTLRRVDVVQLREELAALARGVLLSDGGQRLHGRIAAVNHIAGTVLKKMHRKGHPEIDINSNILDELSASFLLEECDEIGERLRLARQLTLWAERLGGSSPAHLHFPVARLARKTGNPLLAGLHLHKASGNPTLIQGSPALTHLRVAIQGTKMMWPIATAEQRARDFAAVFMALVGAYEIDNHSRQLANINGDFNGSVDAVNNGFLNGFAPHIVPIVYPTGLTEVSLNASLSNEMARAALHLAKWLDENPHVISALPSDCRMSRYWMQLENVRRELGSDLVGSLLVTSTNMTPHLAKAHRRLADWAFRAAEGAAIQKDRTLFDQNYRIFLGTNIDQCVLDGLWTAVSSANSVAQLGDDVMTIMGNDVLTAKSLLETNSYYTNLWLQIRQRRAVYYNLAVSSYFSFISQMGSAGGSHCGTIGSVSVTLRILALLVKHSDFLHEAIDRGLQTTNEHLWKDILPQLFARLSHPVREVRESLIALLSRLCYSAPHVLVFQVVTGASSCMLVDDSDDVIEATEKEEDENTSKERCLMFECCRHLVSVLDAHFPNLVHDVREFVNELQRINLLNEERWAFVLSNLDHEMEKRLDQIRIESEKTVTASHLDEKTRLELIAEKSRLITTSVYRILDDLYERTCMRDPATPNEKTFIDMYGEQLRAVFEQSRANRKSPEKAWAPFKQILGLLLQRTSRRGGHVLQMSDISAVLTNLSKWCVPIPGQESVEYSQVVSIDRVVRNAIVLPTKTRPKKIAFIGSDGKEHMFLFKGQEDLHLDERIMQLLHICNLMLSGSSSIRRWPPYLARHYAVTPLGTRSGLIQWVGGATPMFHIYRKWQVRQAQIKHSLERKVGAAPTTAAVDIDRPTDLYQKKLRAVFTQNNVEPIVLADRSKWPLPLLKEVLQMLVKETPKDLLSRELWMRSGGGDTWWRVVCRLARSTAVMSMVGAILGLGDRHLDNVLVNLDKGDIVHIDYNICFDKGKHLRVPETVPFRLTQNIVHALGPTQVEGVFRESCGHVLATLREGREVLLTVLEAFVYDPLVDWAVADHLTTSSAAVGVAVTLAVYGTDSRAVEAKPVAREMFSVRIRESAVPWMNNCVELTGALRNVMDALERQMRRDETNVWTNGEKLDQERVEAGRRLKTAIARHQHMMKDFRPLLRALATCDDQFSSYMRAYRERFSEPLVKAHQLLEAEPLDMKSCLHQFAVVMSNVKRIYDGLVGLEKKVSRPLTPSLLSQVLNTTLPPGFEDSRPHHKQQQEQNAHAKNVVRRVRARLEGSIDGNDPKKVASPAEQADALIRQATSSTLLAQMYEGWTAWV